MSDAMEFYLLGWGLATVAWIVGFMIIQNADAPSRARNRRDTERLDWLEDQSDGTTWIARPSTTGRGYRLHNTGSAFGGHPTAREAIDQAIIWTDLR